GGSIPIGATAQVVVVFRNENGGPVSTGLIQLYPSSTVSAVVASNQCEGVDIPSGAECAVALSVKGLQSGQWRVEMLMAHSGRTRLTTATISGTVESSGENSNQLTTDVEAIPDALDFGTLNNSQTLVEPVILRNVTSVPIEISDIYIESAESAGYKLTTECEKLEAGQSCIATVSWSPQSSGRSSGVLVIKHSGPAALSSVPLKGEYEPEDVAEAEIFPKAVPGKGLLVASQSQIQFEESVSTASTITVSLVNAGDAPLTLNNIRFGGSDNGLSFKQEGCAEGITLDPIEACPLTVTWSPTRVGSLYDDVQIVHDGARGVLVLPVRGGAAEAVSQDQKAINLSEQITTTVIDPSAPAQENISESEDADIAARQQQAAKENAARVGAAQTKTAISVAVPNPASVLDGYKITSFSPSRAIINGPGGSRLVFDGEETVIGGVPWFIVIQKNGIEFLYQKQRILLLFDRSLSSVNRVTASSSGSTAQTTAANDT
ncbi:MAG: choice-of-anchor D domain-containing protein, partial [Bdellovibrionales bacterium]